MAGLSRGFSENKTLMRRSSEPNSLIKFREAKNEMQKIFIDLSGYVNDCQRFIDSINNEGSSFATLLPENISTQINSYFSKVKAIQEIIERNQMKCAFFGRTSNGKSSIINAMLGSRVVPTGMGHTTGSFLQIEGTEQEHGYITLPSSPGLKHSIDSIRDIANALSHNSLPVDSLVHIYWPSKNCPLLCEEVAILDSPGVDVDPDINAWIDKTCLDADVFILVANAESTIMLAEKNFFYKVSERLSKPNIFILNNRWDQSANEMEFVEEVRQQHSERCRQFLVDELKVCGKDEAHERVFFVSAKEVLQMRTRRDSTYDIKPNNVSGDYSQNGETPQSPMIGSGSPGVFLEGWQSRYAEFANFEKIFQKTLSESAINTKFLSHADQGRVICDELNKGLEVISKNCQENKDSAQRMLQLDLGRIADLRLELQAASKDTELALLDCLATVEQRVAETLHEEIRQLHTLVSNCPHEFPLNPDSLQMRTLYRQKLSEFVETGLGARLDDACTQQMSKEVTRLEDYMLARYQTLDLDDVHRNKMPILLGNSSFRPTFHIDCRNICADFREDISFRFSFGISNIIRRFFKTSNMNRTNSNYFREDSSSRDYDQRMPLTNTTIYPLVASFVPSLIGQNSVAIVVGMGVIMRATGWRVLAVCVATYGGLWLYQYLSWTNKAKERAFKQQYTSYASNKLKMIVDLTSANIGYQVKQEITSSKEKLNGVVNSYGMILKQDCEQMEKDIVNLEKYANEAKRLKNATAFLDGCLLNFQKNFINSPGFRANK